MRNKNEIKSYKKHDIYFRLNYVAGGVKYLLRGIMFKLADGAIGPHESNDEAAGMHSTDVASLNCISVTRFMHVDILSWGDQQME